MKVRRLVPAGILAAIMLLAPQASPASEFLRGVGTYGKDRCNDFLDIIRLRGGFPRDGKGIGAKLRATTFLQAGYVAVDGRYAGLDRRGIGIVDEVRQEAGVSVFYGSYNRMVAVHGNHFLKGDTDWSVVEDRRILRNLPHWDDGRQRLLSFGAEVATPLLGIDVGVYPEEAFDFVLGFFAIDIFNDDQLFGYNIPYRVPEAEAKPNADAPFARKRAEYQQWQDELKVKEAMKAMGNEPATAVPADTAPAEQETGSISREAADKAMMELDRQTTPEAEAAQPEPVQAAPQVESPQDEAPAESEAAAEPEAPAAPPATPEPAPAPETPPE